MQSILNGQHIWRHLCKYHFTKQQLRLAIENHYGLSPTPSWSSNVKFARFVSADGRSICRRPVSQSHRVRQTKTQASSSQIKTAAKQSVNQSDNNTKSSSQRQGNDHQYSSVSASSRLHSESSKQTHEQQVSSLASTMPTTSKNSKQLDRIDESDRRPLICLSSVANSRKAANPIDGSISSNQSTQGKLESHEQRNNNNNRNNTGKQDSSENCAHADKTTRLRDKTNLVDGLGNTTTTTSGAANNTNNNNSCNYRHQEELDWEQVFHQLRK